MFVSSETMFLSDCYVAIYGGVKTKNNVLVLRDSLSHFFQCLNMYTRLCGRRQVCHWSATPGKTPIGKKVASPLKTHWGNWWVGFSNARCRSWVLSRPLSS